MITNYKFAQIFRDDNVHIDWCTVRFFEGDIVTKNVKDINGNIVSVTRYKMLKRLKKADLPHLSDKTFKKEIDPITKQPLNKDVVLYTKKDFGVISTEDELRLFLNKELRKDQTRTPEEKQNTLDITKVK